jgi:hypothetical protein
MFAHICGNVTQFALSFHARNSNASTAKAAACGNARGRLVFLVIFLLNSGSTRQSTVLTHVSCDSFMPADQRGELLEVVNDNNEVVGLKARSVIHSKGLRHRTVYCLVFDSKSRLLLQQRSPR